MDKTAETQVNSPLYIFYKKYYHKENVEEKSTLRRIAERTAFAYAVQSAGSSFMGNSGRPSRSGSNKARQLPLRANEGGRHGIYACNKGGTAYITSLAIEILRGAFCFIGNPCHTNV